MAIDKLEQNHPKDKLCAWSRGGAAAAWLGLQPSWPRVAPFITSIGVSWVYIMGFPAYIYETHGLLIDTRPTVAAVTELSRGGRTATWRLLMPSPLHKPSAFLTLCQDLCRNKVLFVMYSACVKITRATAGCHRFFSEHSAYGVLRRVADNLHLIYAFKH